MIVSFLEEDVEKEIEQAGMISLEVESVCQIIWSSTASSKASKRDDTSRDQDQEPGEASDSEFPSSDNEKDGDVNPLVAQGSTSVLAANPGGVGRDLWRQLKPVNIPPFMAAPSLWVLNINMPISLLKSFSNCLRKTWCKFFGGSRSKY